VPPQERRDPRPSTGSRRSALSRRSLIVSAGATALVVIGPRRAGASPAGRPGAHPSLQSAVEAATALGGATYAVAIWHPASGISAGISQDAVMPAASLYKLVVMLEAYARRASGDFAFDEELVVPAADDPTLLEEEDGVQPGQTVSADQAIELMITLSDNGCALALLDRLGLDAINARAQSIGMTSTLVEFDSVTTASDILLFYRRLLEGSAVDEPSSSEMLARLKRQTINDRLPTRLPDGTPVAHKTGNDDGVVNDAGVIYGPGGPIVVVALAGGVSDEGLATEVEAEIGRLAYEFAADVSPESGDSALAPTPSPLPSPRREGIIQAH
jgi:beta-lactamase class A